ncbi:MAG: hypothetical protein AAGE43_01730 [Pseudomonadota bacterium]
MKPCILPLLLIFCLCGATDARSDGSTNASSWLQFCESAPGAEPIRSREYLHIDGSRRVLSLAEQPDPACTNLELSVPADAVRWFGRVSRKKASAVGRGVILQGLVNEDGEGVRISEVIVSDATETEKAALPLKENLLTALNGRVYGVEERARLTMTGTGLTLECRAGEHPAGVVLRNDRSRLPRVSLELVLTAETTAAFAVGYADGIGHRLEAPKPLGRVTTSGRQTFALPASHNSATGDSVPDFAFTLQCPSAAGSLALANLEVTTDPGVRTPERSIWIWRPSEWLENADALLTELVTLGTPVVYVSVPLADSAPGALTVSHPEALAEFIRRAAERRIDVWAVEGDPHAVLPSGQTHFAERARALDAFNAGQPAAERLAGVQYDIEPYLLPEFALDQDAWLAAYVETIAGLKRELTMPLEVAVPFWWSGLTTGGGRLLDRLAPHVDGVNVMNYRTDPVLLQQFAEPFLAWGATEGVAVRIALEAGPIADEDRWHYRAAESGRLWLRKIGGEDVLVLLDRPRPSPTGLALSLSHQSQLVGSHITFKGDLTRMQGVMAELELIWSVWPSFAGLALHEYRLAELTH